MTRSKVGANDVDALTDAVLTASRLLVAVSARSLAAAEETITCRSSGCSSSWTAEER